METHSLGTAALVPLHTRVRVCLTSTCKNEVWVPRVRPSLPVLCRPRGAHGPGPPRPSPAVASLPRAALRFPLLSITPGLSPLFSPSDSPLCPRRQGWELEIRAADPKPKGDAHPDAAIPCPAPGSSRTPRFGSCSEDLSPAATQRWTHSISPHFTTFAVRLVPAGLSGAIPPAGATGGNGTVPGVFLHPSKPR